MASFLTLLQSARSGDPVALGQLLQYYFPYLAAIAQANLEPCLQAKLGGSDLIQQTLVEAVDGFTDFRGSEPEELLAWLRCILLNNLNDARRTYLGTAARDIRREAPNEDSKAIYEIPDESGLSPSSEVRAEEDLQRLEIALERIPTEYRQIIEWRNRDQLRFVEIGERLGRSPDAARMLWNRALERLQTELTRTTSGSEPDAKY